MTIYKGVSEGSGATVAGPYLKYNAVLDDARAYAQRATTNVVILEDDKPVMIVNPNGSTRKPNPGYRVGG